MSINLITSEDIKKVNDPTRNIFKRIGIYLKIRYENPSFPTLHMTEKGDWIDLKSAERYELKAGEFALINLGIAMEIPDNFEAWLAPRSGTFKKYGLLQTNSIGIIDNSYSGNNDIWKMPVYATRDTVVEKGDRLCQFRLIERMHSIFDRKITRPSDLYIVEVENLNDSDRGGFGSSGR